MENHLETPVGLDDGDGEDSEQSSLRGDVQVNEDILFATTCLILLWL